MELTDVGRRAFAQQQRLLLRQLELFLVQLLLLLAQRRLLPLVCPLLNLHVHIDYLLLDLLDLRFHLLELRHLRRHDL
jgi:hypothetical protein